MDSVFVPPKLVAYNRVAEKHIHVAAVLDYHRDEDHKIVYSAVVLKVKVKLRTSLFNLHGPDLRKELTGQTPFLDEAHVVM